MYGNIINMYFIFVKAFAFVHLWFAAHVRTAYTSVVPLFFQFSGFSFFSIVFPLMNTHLRVCAIVSQRGLGSRLGLDLWCLDLWCLGLRMSLPGLKETVFWLLLCALHWHTTRTLCYWWYGCTGNPFVVCNMFTCMCVYIHI